ncbi:Uncharacterized protein PECH_001452 [Penicillium ucsense]|uniref:Hydrophobin n=1 Tax=Penicillium ucsense TaxID=2839758 RepID=A0A8J8WLJ1_9EURO|nr:Uncharacterized protein PECM_001092 [Penicillium ucsense]KAF7738224.1 Uncharacterized protein PECH_001452 [Penicillium ucsense]
MKYFVALSLLAASAIALPTEAGGKKSEGKKPSNEQPACGSQQTVVCSGNGNGGLLSLGNILTGLLGESCSGGDVYCCSEEAVNQVGLINLDLNLQCSLNHLL